MSPFSPALGTVPGAVHTIADPIASRQREITGLPARVMSAAHGAYARACRRLARALTARAAMAFLRAGDPHQAEHCRAALAAGQCHTETCTGSVLSHFIPALEAIALLKRGEATIIATSALLGAGVWDISAPPGTPPRPLEDWLLYGPAWAHGLRGRPSVDRLENGPEPRSSPTDTPDEDDEAGAGT